MTTEAGCGRSDSDPARSHRGRLTACGLSDSEPATGSCVRRPVRRDESNLTVSLADIIRHYQVVDIIRDVPVTIISGQLNLLKLHLHSYAAAGRRRRSRRGRGPSRLPARSSVIGPPPPRADGPAAAAIEARPEPESSAGPDGWPMAGGGRESNPPPSPRTIPTSPYDLLEVN